MVTTRLPTGMCIRVGFSEISRFPILHPELIAWVFFEMPWNEMLFSSSQMAGLFSFEPFILGCVILSHSHVKCLELRIWSKMLWEQVALGVFRCVGYAMNPLCQGRSLPASQVLRSMAATKGPGVGASLVPKLAMDNSWGTSSLGFITAINKNSMGIKE